MPRRLRNKVLIWIIGLGLLNFLAYTIMYAYIGGDAPNGKVLEGAFYVRGHFLRDAAGQASEVSKGVWIYCYAHSVSIWPTIGLVLCSMLILARPHIIATMDEDSLVQGRSFVTAALTTIVVVTGAIMLHFLVDFIRALTLIQNGQNYGV